MKTFKDLEFKAHPAGTGGVQAMMFFPNGYGVSVIRANFSYGGREGKFEIAVLKGNAHKWDLCYTTSVTEDVIGHQSVEDVTAVMAQVQALS